MHRRRPAPSLRQRALMWLAQREHSRLELQEKLRRWVQALQALQGLTTAAASPSRADDGARASASSSAMSPGASGPAQPPLPDAGEITALLDDLEAAGHLSHERLLESRLQVRSARFGNLRIERELQRLGVEPSPQARAELRGTELSRARGVWERKFGQAATSPAERAKQMRFLASRGFSPETIRVVLSQRAGDGAADDEADDAVD